MSEESTRWAEVRAIVQRLHETLTVVAAQLRDGPDAPAMPDFFRDLFRAQEKQD